jgi:hypothetical protein
MRVAVGLIVSFLIPAGLASAAAIYDSYNIGLALQDNQGGDECCVYGVTDIGWYYTPSTSYTLTQIETLFDTLGTDRTITFAVFTDTPANGGVELGSATSPLPKAPSEDRYSEPESRSPARRRTSWGWKMLTAWA